MKRRATKPVKPKANRPRASMKALGLDARDFFRWHTSAGPSAAPGKPKRRRCLANSTGYRGKGHH
jgi:hypothetical protein